MKSVGFGIIGCGMIARFHAGALERLPGARIVGAADEASDYAAAFAVERGIRAYATVDEMLGDREIEAVCVCTPSGTHAGLGAAAARAGRHIVLEKPAAITMAQAGALREAVKASGVGCCVISQMRFMEGPMALKLALEDGALGRLLTCRLTMLYHRPPSYYAQSGWRGTWAMDGGGALMNQGIHGVDLLRWLMGPVETLSARAATLVHSIEVEDTLSAALAFQNGALGTLEAATSLRSGSPLRLMIAGTRGSVELEEARIAAWDVEGTERPAESRVSEARDAGSNDPRAIDPEGHMLQLGDFLEALRRGRPPRVGLEDGLEAVRIVTAVYASAREDRVIRL